MANDKLASAPPPGRDMFAASLDGAWHVSRRYERHGPVSFDCAPRLSSRRLVEHSRAAPPPPSTETTNVRSNALYNMLLPAPRLRPLHGAAFE